MKRLPALATIAAMAVAPLFHPCGMAGEHERRNELMATVRQVTSGPKHHFFGYIGYALTMPWNASGRYIVALETDFFERMPAAGEAATIVIVGTKDNRAITVLDKTLAWNLQQGTMLHWNPDSPETQFFFNLLSAVEGQFS